MCHRGILLLGFEWKRACQLYQRSSTVLAWFEASGRCMRGYSRIIVSLCANTVLVWLASIRGVMLTHYNILCSLAYWHFEKKSLYITLITRSFSALSWPLLSEHWYWHFKLSLMHLYRLNLKCEHWMRQKANPLLLQNVTVADMDMTVLRWFYVLDASLHNSKHAAHIFIFLRFFFFDIA